jgi:hypothetical protein
MANCNSPPTPNRQEGTHCSWASIVLGAVSLLMAAPVLQLTFVMATVNAANKYNPATTGEWLAAVGAYVTGFLFLVLSLAGLRFGARGVRVGWRTGEPVVLSEVGIYLSLTAALLWAGVAYALHAQALPICERPRHAAVQPQRRGAKVIIVDCCCRPADVVDRAGSTIGMT